MFGLKKKLTLPTAEDALVGRKQEMITSNVHDALATPLKEPFPRGLQSIYFGMGCFWGAERKFWSLDGVFSTSVGYAGGFTANPTYEEVCSGQTGHNEVVRVVYNPKEVSLSALLTVFWESHDPTQGMQQGNDRGTQYRSGVYYESEDILPVIEKSLTSYEKLLKDRGFCEITTEIKPVNDYYYAEAYHQQYLHKNPNGYCGLGGTGVCFNSKLA